MYFYFKNRMPNFSETTVDLERLIYPERQWNCKNLISYHRQLWEGSSWSEFVLFLTHATKGSEACDYFFHLARICFPINQSNLTSKLDTYISPFFE